jgi:hypothetical protein
MSAPVDSYFNTLEEPCRSCLLYLRKLILDFSPDVIERRKNNTPFYYFKNRWFAFISYHPKTKEIFISFVHGNRIVHPKLVSEGRKQMKIFRVDPEKDIDVKNLKAVLKLALEDLNT